MKISQISTYSLYSTATSDLSRIREQLSIAQKELSTGRHVDIGLELGSKVATDVSLRLELEKIETRNDTNVHLASRLDTMQEALAFMVSRAQDFAAELTTSLGNASDIGRAVTVNHAESGLAALKDAGNTTFAGAYVFAGDNISQAPFGDYFSEPISAARQAVSTEFVTQFGITQNDPAVESISATAFDSFLANEFSDLFSDPNWGTTWSSASDSEFKVEISESALVSISATAQNQAFRDLASGLTMIADLGAENMNGAAYETVALTALENVNRAISGLIEMQSSLGLVQDQVETRTTYDSVRMNVVTNQIYQLESVDATETATRLSSLLTQLEASYAATARIQSLSLINFI